MLDLEFAELTDCGRVRPHNEDFLGHAVPATPQRAQAHGWLFALADGVGGQESGEVASQLAVETLVGGFQQAPSGEPHAALLQRLVRAANTRIFEATFSAHPPVGGMATTLVACALRYDRAAVAHAGDSRCYLLRGGGAEQLTRDHTLVGEQMRLGILSEQEAAESETRHLLSRSLGSHLMVNVEINEHQLVPGDVLLLCCDGLHGPVRAGEMAQIVGRAAQLEEAARELVALANQRDGSDNISVQLIRIRSVERVGMYRGRPYKLH